MGEVSNLKKFLPIILICLCLAMCCMPDKEVVFSADLKDETPVYADIVTVVPTAVAASNSITRGVFCSCTTTSGETIKVYVRVSDYKNYFDATASFSNPLLFSADALSFSSPVRIHGCVRNQSALVSPAPKEARVFLFESRES